MKNLFINNSFYRLFAYIKVYPRIYLALLFSAVLYITGCSHTNVETTGEQPELDQQKSAVLQEILDTAAADEASVYPGAIFRLETPEGIWNGTAGVTNIETKSAIDPDAKFRCGSIVKPFISVVILQLVEEGKLSLEDTLPEALEPDISELFEYSNSITVEMLLNHTSGIGEWVGEYVSIFDNYPLDKIWSEREFFKMAVDAGTNFRPGQSYQYNNTEYNLLGLIIERVTGLSWRENIRRRIFSRLSLKNTVLPEPGTMNMPGSYINGYEIFHGELTDTTDIDPSMAGAAGGHALVSNTKDLSVFIKALLEGVFFQKPETLSTMLTFVETGNSIRTYGLGIGRYMLPNGMYAYGHTGGTAGYGTFMLHFPEEGVTAASVITTDQGAQAFLAYLIPTMDLFAGRTPK